MSDVSVDQHWRRGLPTDKFVEEGRQGYHMEQVLLIPIGHGGSLDLHSTIERFSNRDWSTECKQLHCIFSTQSLSSSLLYWSLIFTTTTMSIAMRRRTIFRSHAITRCTEFAICLRLKDMKKIIWSPIFTRDRQSNYIRGNVVNWISVGYFWRSHFENNRITGSAGDRLEFKYLHIIIVIFMYLDIFRDTFNCKLRLTRRQATGSCNSNNYIAELSK